MVTLFKNGGRERINNIETLMSVEIKMPEIVTRDVITEHIDKNIRIQQSQDGFMNMKSGLTNPF